MKKVVNLLALAVLLGVNVLTPITYAQENLEDLTDVSDDAVNLLTEENLEAEESQVPEVSEPEVSESEKAQVTEVAEPEEPGEVSALLVLEESVQSMREVLVGQPCADGELFYKIGENDSDNGDNSALKSVDETFYCAKELTDYKDVNGVVVPLLDRNLGAESAGDTGFYYSWGVNLPYTGDNRNGSWATGDQGPCPDDYHVPTIAEWSAFIVARCEAENVCDLKELVQDENRSDALLYSWKVDGKIGNNTGEITSALSRQFPIVGTMENGELKLSEQEKQTILWVSNPVIQTNHENQPHDLDVAEEPRTNTQARGFYFADHAKKGGWGGLHESPKWEGNQIRCIADSYDAPTLLAIDVYLGDEDGTDTGDTMDNEDWVKREFVDKSSTLTKDSILSGVTVADIDGYEVVWYDASGAEINFSSLDLTDVSDLKVIGMYEPKKSIEYNGGDITYTDTNGKVFSGIGTITITYGDKSITMLDRNLGAESSGTGCDSALILDEDPFMPSTPSTPYVPLTSIGGLDGEISKDLDREILKTAVESSNDCEGDYGYHFQWGNNHGFPIDVELETGDQYVDVSNYSWNNPYVSGAFVQMNGDWNYGDWGKPSNQDLWGGTGDYNNAGGDSSADYRRQGPCPEGFHVPSQSELTSLLRMYFDVRGYEEDYSIGKYDNNGFRMTDQWEMGVLVPKFLNDFRIPLAGYRNFGDGQVMSFGKVADFWSSSPYSPTQLTYSHNLHVDDDEISSQSFEHRGVAQSVRCFADTYEEGKEPFVLYYDTEESSDIQAQTIPAGENGYLPGYTTHRNDDEKFLGWFNEDMTKEYTLSGNKFTNLIMSESLAEDGVVTVYAKWGHKVTFLDYDGTVLNVQAVLSGKSAVAPADPSRNGYIFSGWNADITNVTGDMEVTAQYTQKSSGGNSGGSSSGGGGGSSANKTDTTKEEKTNEDTEKTEQKEQTPAEPQEENNTQKSPVNTQGGQNNSQGSSKYSEESQEAYKFAYKNGITTKSTIEEANMSGPLTRIQMAKMLSQYAINVLGKTPDTSKVANFRDVTDKKDADYDSGVTLAYQLGIMGINMPNNKFRPDDIVTRGEFATAFSRMLFNTSDGKYISTSKYYTLHMLKLRNEGIIKTDMAPKSLERRGYVMIMLMRSVK